MSLKRNLFFEELNRNGYYTYHSPYKTLYFITESICVFRMIVAAPV
jgi:hypothetical protein